MNPRKSSESSPSSVSSVSIPATDAEAVSRRVLSLAAIGHDPRLIPETWDEQAALIDAAVAMGQRLTLVIAQIVARSREQFDDPAIWMAACTERWGWERAHTHHMRSVGELINRAIARHECGATTLNAMEFDKLLALSRLPEHLFSTFMERNDPSVMSRDSVRTAVNRWLDASGVPPEEVPPPPRLPTARPQADFLDVLFAPDTGEPPAEYQNRVHARAASVPATEQSKVLFRSLVVVDAMVDRMSGPLLLMVAEQLRKVADSAERLARQPAGKALGPHV